MIPLRPLFAAAVFAAAAPGAAAAQTPADSTQAAQDSAVRVFLDCPTYFCDLDFFRTEIRFVNYVRDRGDAHVHILLTTQSTGAGGTEFTLAFIGLRQFAGTADTLRYVSPPATTDDEVRRGLAQTLRLGLVRFAARTPVAPRIQVSFDAPRAAAAQVRDPWNYWVYRARLNTNLNGESSYRSGSLNVNLSANRVTEEWKIRLNARSWYNHSLFEVPIYDSTGAEIGVDRITSISREYEGEAAAVRSLSSHWSARLEATAFSSTYINTDLALSITPGIEFNIFPYSESTRRQLTLRYEVRGRVVDYRDTTIYDKTRETLFQHGVEIELEVKQPWGSANVSLEGAHYLHDLTRNRVELFGGADIRLYRGLALNVFASVTLVHDQLFLPKGGATPTEVLLRRRELATSYQYYTSMGLSYTFGSIYNNIVNPRF